MLKLPFFFTPKIMREKYIKMRNDKVMDLNFLYDYFISKGGTLSTSEFMSGINLLFIEPLLDNLDQEYDVVKLFDAEGNFIKITN